MCDKSTGREIIEFEGPEAEYDTKPHTTKSLRLTVWHCVTAMRDYNAADCLRTDSRASAPALSGLTPGRLSSNKDGDAVENARCRYREIL